jgi:hypothetical protein
VHGTLLLALVRVAISPYVQDVRPDGFTVAWETEEAVAGELYVDGKLAARTEGTRHETQVTGLASNKRFAWEARSAGDKVGAGNARTAPPASAGTLDFVVWGDNRDGDEDSAIARAILGEQPQLLLNTGDLVPKGGDEAGWRTFFSREAPLLAEVPLYPACGNHELYGDTEGSNFRRRFVLPDEGRSRRYYTFRFGPARFVMLDGNGRHAEQAEWLHETLKAAAAAGERHVFVVLHQPPFSVGGHCGAAVAQSAWVNEFESSPLVRAVFGGHDHAYMRMERRGVRYFVTGGGGAPLYGESEDCPSFDREAKRVYVAEHHFLRVRVRGDDIEVTAIRPDGTTIETVRLPAYGTALVAGPAAPLHDDRSAFQLWRRKHRHWWVAPIALVAIALVIARRRR